MDFLPLNHGVIFEQWLDVFPAREGTHFTNRQIDDIQETPPGRFAEHGAFHVSGLHLAPTHHDLAGGIDRALADVERVAIALRETQDDGDLVLGSGIADAVHVLRVIREGILEVSSEQAHVDGAAPA